MSYNEKNSQMYWHLPKTVTIKGQFEWIFINATLMLACPLLSTALSIFPRISALPLDWQRWHLAGQEYIHVGPIFSIPPIPRLSGRRKSSNMCARSWIFPPGYWAWPVTSSSSNQFPFSINTHKPVSPSGLPVSKHPFQALSSLTIAHNHNNGRSRY